MPNIYLVDYENVNSWGLKNASLLNKEDELVIFYSNNASINSDETLAILNSCKAKVVTKKVYLCGENSLDFQLVAYLGQRVQDNGEDTYYIVSRDKGYYSVILFLQDIADIYLIPKILIDANQRTTYRRGAEEVIGELYSGTIRKKIKGIKWGKEEIDPMLIILMMQKNKTKQDYHNNLVKMFNNRIGPEIYKRTKGVYILVKGQDK